MPDNYTQKNAPVTLTELKINPRFRDLIPPLSEQERKQLEANIVADGCRDPIVTWRGVIVDGHNRYEICTHREIAFQTFEIEFADEDEAAIWIIRNQFGRRNLTPYTRGELALKLEPLIKAKANENLKTAKAGVRGGSPCQKSDKAIDTKKELAKIAGVSHDTIAKVKFIRDNADEETKQKLRSQPDMKVHRVHKEIKEKQDREKRQAKRIEAAKSAPKNLPGFIQGDFREVSKSIADGTVDLIFTDPPYDRDTLPLYGDLAEIAASKLCEGGSLICYLGQYQIDKVLNLITPHLKFWWTLAVIHTGQFARMDQMGIRVTWKPMLWFVKGKRHDKQTFIDDSVDSRQEKSAHDWQQSVLEASYYVEKLCPKNGRVFDPFCGGGTTALACKDLGRRFVTCDIDAETLALAMGRF